MLLYPYRVSYAESTQGRMLPESSSSATSVKEASTEQSTNLGEVVVQRKKLSSKSIAKRTLAREPSSTSIVDQKDVERGRVGTNADVLAYQPGVTAQSVGGNDALRISIRGSGLNAGTGYFREGITFLFDGLPVTGPGGTPFELFEPQGLQYTEVLRGAIGGLKYGGLNLGGAINYVTKTGYESTPIEARYEGGSFGYHKMLLGSGGVIGSADYYVSAVGSLRQGFQQHTEAKSGRFIGNFGYKFLEGVDTRFYFRYAFTDFQFNPSGISLNQVLSDPTQPNMGDLQRDFSRRHPGSIWLGNKTSIKIDQESKLDIGWVYHNYPITILGWDGGPNTVIGHHWFFEDITGLFRYSRSGRIFEKQSNSSIGFLTTTEIGDSGFDAFTIKTLTPTTLLKTRFDGSANHSLFANNDIEILPGFWTSTGLQLAWIDRKSRYIYPPSKVLAFDKHYFGVSMRIGARYEITPDVLLYINFSRAVEPVDSWKYGTIPGFSNFQGFRDFKLQAANTFEIGTRGRVGIFDWTLALYRSWIQHELLTRRDPASPTTVDWFNATPTIHQGIELALTTQLWREANSERQTNTEQSPGLLFRQAYTLNDFFYRHDPDFGSNQLPGLPTHFYQGELFYIHSSGAYAAFSAQISSSYHADFANTLNVPAYTLFGIKIGYQLPKRGIDLFLDFRNLTDEKYVASTYPLFNMLGDRNAPTFQPGDGFGVFGGIAYQYH